MFSVIVPTWSVTSQLGDMWKRNAERLQELASMPTQLVWVDNGSPERREAPADTVLFWDTNRGIAPAWNAGAELATGDVLCWLNSDVVVEPGWDQALCAAVLDQPPRIAFPRTNGEQNDGVGVAGWCFACTRETWRLVGPFDEQFATAFYEDTDWFHRAAQQGVSLVTARAANVRHERRTTARHLPHLELLFARNRYRFARKHGLDATQPPDFWTRPLVEV